MPILGLYHSFLSNFQEINAKQAGAELYQALFKLELAKPDIVYSLRGHGSQLAYDLWGWSSNWSYMLGYFSRICSQLSGGSAVSYLDDLRPVIWRICGQLSGGSTPIYLVNCENKANSAQLELELGLSLAI